jgi:ATP adenylyltransferase
MIQTQRQPIDITAYSQRSQEGPCFICRIVENDPVYPHHIVYEDALAIAFLNKYPTLFGYTLVAPKDHREHVTGDFSLDEYLALQRFVYRVAEAVRKEVSAERVYLLSLGSQQGNSHVHWHIAPLPPGVPYNEQQTEAISFEKGYLKLSEEELAALSIRLRQRIEKLSAKRITSARTREASEYSV